MLRKIGYGLMIIGLFLPLALMSNMTVRQFSEHKNYQTYLKTIKDNQAKNKQLIEAYQKSIQSGEMATVDPFAEKNKTVSNETITKFGDTVIGYLTIPSLDIKQAIYVGASEEHLNLGSAVVTGTGLPVGGIGNRSVIAGHRSWYNDLRFFRLNEMRAGDPIYIEINGKTMTYLVKDVEIIKATDWQKLLPDKDQDLLTLLTCDPLIPPFDYRLLVNAVRQVDVATSTEGTSDSSSASTPTQKKQTTIAKAVQSNPYNLIFFVTLIGWVVEVWLIRRFIALFVKKGTDQVDPA